MEKATIIKNWRIGTTLKSLKYIHQKGVNISIYDRDVDLLENEINSLLNLEVEIKSKGSVDIILEEVKKVINPNEFPLVYNDIESLLYLFKKVSASENLKLLVAIVNTNMCRRFHTDVNDLRMLCTYAGSGTLWLPEDNINREALLNYGNNESIVIDEHNIQQVDTGSVIILKGSKYVQNDTNAVVHRSPAIEGNNETRLLLRIDTNQFLNNVNN